MVALDTDTDPDTDWFQPNTGSMGGAHPTRITGSRGVVLGALLVAARAKRVGSGGR